MLSPFMALAGLAGTAPAQTAADHATPFMAPDHWAMDAARRLDALGLAPRGFDAGRRSVTRGEVAAVLVRAARTVDGWEFDILNLADDYLARFAEEFPSAVAWARAEADAGGGGHTGGSSAFRLQWLGARVAAGYHAANGRVLAGTRDVADGGWSGVRPLDDLADTRIRGAASVSVTRFASARIGPAVVGGGRNVEAWQVTAEWRSVGLWFGRRKIGFGTGRHGAIVVNPRRTFDGGGFFLAEPLVLPGFFEHLGPVRGQVYLARLEENRFVHPWFVGMRGSIRPHPRLTIGLNRGAMFGGEGNTAFTARNLFYVLIGKHGGKESDLGNFENQVASLDMRWNVPVDAIPTTAYMEWGMDDSSGGWWEDPGILLGLRVPSIPGLPEWSIGIERTHFLARPGQGDRDWYQHSLFKDGWTVNGQPLGHPLGGEGLEWLAYISADLLGARLRLDAQAFLRDRDPDNLFAPEREGRSRGGAVRIEYRARPGFEVWARGMMEDGSADWRESAFAAGVRLLLHP